MFFGAKEVLLALGLINSQPVELEQDDVLCLAKSLYFEARGEDADGQIASAWVHINRVNDIRFPNTICEVTKSKDAFTWYWDGKSDKIKDWEAYEDVLFIAVHVLNGDIPDNTNSATHYYAHNKVTPYWSSHKSFTFAGIIGNHTFMIEGDRNL